MNIFYHYLKIAKSSIGAAQNIIKYQKIKDDNELLNSVLNGNIKVSEIKDNKDIIIMVFSTPEGEEMISYVVDSPNKTIVEPFDIDSKKGTYDGRFSNFFSWNKI